MFKFIKKQNAQLRRNPIQGTRLFGFMGLIFLGVGGWKAYHDADFLAHSIPASLYVVQVDVKKDEDGRSYRPVFSMSYEGQERTYKENFWMSPKPHEKGEMVAGYFDPETGRMVSEEVLQFLKLFSRMFVGAGAVMLLVAGWFWRKHLQKRGGRIKRTVARN